MLSRTSRNGTLVDIGITFNEQFAVQDFDIDDGSILAAALTHVHSRRSIRFLISAVSPTFISIRSCNVADIRFVIVFTSSLLL